MDERALLAQNPHLTTSDLPAVRRLSFVYAVLDEMLSAAPSDYLGGDTLVKLRLDEFHRLLADALRLEQELGITFASRVRHKAAEGAIKWPDLSAMKSGGGES